MSAANPDPFDDLPDEPQVAWAKSVLPHAEAAAAALGVPVEGVLAQAALESGWGRSAPGGNLFGIKSHGQPGGTVQATTEYVGGQPVQESASFRSYADPAASVADYAEFLRTNPRYAGVLGAGDVETFARGLQSAGYATDPQYAGKLIATAQSPYIRAALAGRGASNRDPFADLPDDPAQAVTTPPGPGMPPIADATSAPVPAAGPSEPDPFADLPDDPNFTGAQGNGLSRAVGTGQAVWPEEPNPAVAGGFVPPAPGTPVFDPASVRAEAGPLPTFEDETLRERLTRYWQNIRTGAAQSLTLSQWGQLISAPDKATPPTERLPALAGLAADPGVRAALGVSTDTDAVRALDRLFPPMLRSREEQIAALAADPYANALPESGADARAMQMLGGLGKQGTDLPTALMMAGGAGLAAAAGAGLIARGAVGGAAGFMGPLALTQQIPDEVVQALRAAGVGHLAPAGTGEGFDPAALLRAGMEGAALGASFETVLGGGVQALRQVRSTADALDAARAVRQGLPPEPSAPAADPRLVEVTPEGVVVPQRAVVDDLPGLDGQPAGRVPPAPEPAPAAATAPAARPSTVVDTAGTDVAASAAARAAEFARLAELAENPEVAAALRRLGEGAPPPSSAARETVVTPTGRAVETQFEVIDAGNLITSDRPEFPAELQPRERGARLASDAQIAGIAARLDPEQLGSSRLASTGAPIVGPDGIVESGNGRVAAIRRAYAQGGPQADAYRAMVEAHGLSTEGMTAPVLVRRRTSELTPEERVAFALDANRDAVASLSAAEQARADARALDDGTLALWQGGSAADAGNVEFARGFIGRTGADPAAMLTAEGRLSAEGTRRIEAAWMARAYDDADLLGRLLEDPEPNIKAIGGAYLDAAPAIARLRAEVARGDVPAELDLSGGMVEAARLVAQARRERRALSEVLTQGDMLGGGASAEARAVLDLLFRDGELRRTLSRERMGELLRYYGERAADVRAGASLFNDLPAVTLDDLLAATRRRKDEFNTRPDENPAAAESGGAVAGTGSAQARQPAGGRGPAGPGEPDRAGAAAGAGAAGGPQTAPALTQALREPSPAVADAGPAPAAVELLDAASGRVLADVPGATALGRTVQHAETGQLPSGLRAVASPADVAHVVAPLRRGAQEGVLAVVTDDAGQVLRIARIAKGSATEAPVDPGAVAGAITSTPGGTRAWLAHNHPSGIVRQSEADAALADHLGDLLDGSGVRFEGSVVVGPGGREFTLVPPREAELQGATTAAPRRGTLPVTERRLTGRDTGHAPIASSADAAAALERVAGDAPGVLMLDAQRRPVGWVEMTGGELRELRAGAGGGSARLLSAMDRTNAVAMVVRTDSEAAVGNLNAFGTATGRQLVDAIDRHGVSRLERGDLPTQSTFYANPFEPAVRAAGDYVRRNAGTQAAAALAGGVAAGTLSDEKIGSARWWLQVAAGAATAMFGSAVLRGLRLVGPDSFAARGLDRAGEWFSGLPLLGTGPAELRALKKQQQLMRQVVDRQTAEVGKILRSQFTAEERAMMADLIESRGIVREAGRVHRQAAELDAYLIHVGERMQALGMLPADLELGGYLHRYYRQHLGLDAGFREAKGQSLSGSYSLARGTVDEVDPAFLSPGARERLARLGELQREIAAAERKATRKGVAGDVTLDGLRAELKTLRSQPLHEYIGEQNGALRSFWFAADEVPRVPETAALRPEGNRTRAPALPGHGLPPEQGARLTATERLWYPRGEAKGQAVLWRDWTKAERTRWGEIEDAGYRYVRGLAEASHDLSLATLFKAVADNPSWASHDARAGWQQVPTASVGSGSRLRRYGALSGMWVEPNAWAHLRSYARPVFGDSLVARGYRAALGHWKAWKTVLNPVSHFNNLFSNTQMLYFAGYGPTALARGARLMVRGEKDVLWREARDAGLFGDDFVAAELGRKTGGTRALSELADELLKQTDDADVVGTVSATSKALAQTVSVLTAPVRGYTRSMEWLYRAEDDLFKLAVYAAERRKGVGAAEAVATAQRSFFDYGDLPRAVQWIRSFPVGAPFISYTWKALPAVVRHAVERPERVLALAAALEGVHFAAMATGGLIDRGREYWQMVEDEDRALPDYEQGRVLWGGRKTVRLPGLDGYRLALGNAHVLGNPFATESSGEKAAAVAWIPQTWGPDVFGGNPLARLLVDLATNEDWKGKPIWHEGAPTAERWKRGLAYVYQNLAPSTPLMPGGYHQMRILESAAADAKRGEAGLLPAVVAAANDSLRALGMDQFTGENRYGELAAPTRDALLAAVGIKLRPLNLDQTERSTKFEFEQQTAKSQQYIATEGQKRGRDIIDDATFEARTAPAQQDIASAQMKAQARAEAIDRLRQREEKKPPR